MTWLEVPFLLGVVGALFLSIKKIDDRIDGISERLSRIEGQMSSLPKRRSDWGSEKESDPSQAQRTRISGIDFDI